MGVINTRVEKSRGELFPFSDTARSKMISYNNAERIDIITSNGSKSGTKALTNIKRISKDSYVDLSTGEVREYKKSVSKADNIVAVKQSVRKIRMLILNNFTAFEGFHITLTYSEPMSDFNTAAKDYAKFFDRLKYYYHQYSFEYLRIIEPHAKGACHIHVIIKSGVKGQQIRIEENVVSKLWHGGSVKVTQIYNVEGLARYFGTFHSETTDQKNNLKTMDKQSRWHYYPSNVRIYSKSKGIKYPAEIVTSYADAKKLLAEYKLISDPITYHAITESDDVVNSVLYERYKKD